jgi:hypothetical protein
MCLANDRRLLPRKPTTNLRKISGKEKNKNIVVIDVETNLKTSENECTNGKREEANETKQVCQPTKSSLCEYVEAKKISQLNRDLLIQTLKFTLEDALLCPYSTTCGENSLERERLHLNPYVSSEKCCSGNTKKGGITRDGTARTTQNEDCTMRIPTTPPHRPRATATIPPPPPYHSRYTIYMNVIPEFLYMPEL